MDGWVTIGTKLDTKDLEKNLKDTEKKLKNFEKDTEKLTKRKAKLEIDTKTSEKNIEILNNKIEQTYEKMQKEKEKLASIPTWRQESPEYQKQIEKIDKIKNSYDSLLAKHEIAANKINNQEKELEDVNEKIKQNTNQQGLLNNEIDEMNRKINQSKGLDNIKDSISQASNSMAGVIKSTSRWVLAIFSVRSAYMGLRSAINIVSQYNEQIAIDIEYIKYALAMTLQPIIERIINLVYKLIVYIGYIVKGLLGVNIFAKASAKSFQKANESSGGIKNNIDDASKSAKKLNKELAGFDEMNVLGSNVDTADSGAGAGGGGGAIAPLPSFDLSAPEDIPIPKWLQWIVDNKDLLIGALAGITAGLVALKTFGLKPIQALGIGSILAGIIWLIQDITDFLNDPTWQNFVSILADIAIIIGGVMMVALNSWWGLLVVIVGLIVKLVVENWDTICKILGQIGDWIYKNVIEPVVKAFKSLWDKIVQIFSPVIDFFSSIFGTVAKNIGITIDNIKKIFSALFEEIRRLLTPFIEGFVEGFRTAWKSIKKVFEPAVNFFGEMLSKIGGKLSEWGGKIGDIIGSAFKGVVNGVLTAIENILNRPIKTINGLIGIINKIPGVPDLEKLETFKLPRLAKGGIISQPGRGVPIAIGGEGGVSGSREGVIPLTDSQQMAMLGEAIGKFININLTNITKLDNRQIAKEQKRINAQNDFAFNR